jgi:hypothetical protein
MSSRSQSNSRSAQGKANVHVKPTRKKNEVEVTWSYDEELPSIMTDSVPPQGRTLDWKGKRWFLKTVYLPEFSEAVEATGRKVIKHGSIRELSRSQACDSFLGWIPDGDIRKAVVADIEPALTRGSGNEQELLEELKAARDRLAENEQGRIA